MTIQTELLAEIESFLPLAGIRETTFGLRAVNDGKFVGRLRAADNMTLATLEKARAYMRNYAEKQVEESKPSKSRRAA